MYGKIQITGDIELMTGMHIGGSDAFAAIGAVDSPVFRDARDNYPMIPGSSLKGKLRSLLAKAYNEVPGQHDNDASRITRLFGTAKKEHVMPSRLLVSDMLITEQSKADFKSHGITGFTEVKFENTINRLTAVANPRQIERVIRGTVFGLDMIYEVCKEDEIVEDFQTLAYGLRLLQYDYIGGHGSRGYGKIQFLNVLADCVVGEIPQETMDKLNTIMQEALSD